MLLSYFTKHAHSVAINLCNAFDRETIDEMFSNDVEPRHSEVDFQGGESATMLGEDSALTGENDDSVESVSTAASRSAGSTASRSEGTTARERELVELLNEERRAKAFFKEQAARCVTGIGHENRRKTNKIIGSMPILEGINMRNYTTVSILVDENFRNHKFLEGSWHLYDVSDPHSMCSKCMKKIQYPASLGTGEEEKAMYYERTLADMITVKYRNHKSNFNNAARKVVMGKYVVTVFNESPDYISHPCFLFLSELQRGPQVWGGQCFVTQDLLIGRLCPVEQEERRTKASLPPTRKWGGLH